MDVLDPVLGNDDALGLSGAWLAAHEVAEPDDRAHRRPQLVAHAREEVALRAVRALEGRDRGGYPLRQQLLLGEHDPPFDEEGGPRTEGREEVRVVRAEQAGVLGKRDDGDPILEAAHRDDRRVARAGALGQVIDELDADRRREEPTGRRPGDRADRAHRGREDRSRWHELSAARRPDRAVGIFGEHGRGAAGDRLGRRGQPPPETRRVLVGPRPEQLLDVPVCGVRQPCLAEPARRHECDRIPDGRQKRGEPGRHLPEGHIGRGRRRGRDAHEDRCRQRGRRESGDGQTNPRSPDPPARLEDEVRRREGVGRDEGADDDGGEDPPLRGPEDGDRQGAADERHGRRDEHPARHRADARDEAQREPRLREEEGDDHRGQRDRQGRGSV